MQSRNNSLDWVSFVSGRNRDCPWGVILGLSGWFPPITDDILHLDFIYLVLESVSVKVVLVLGEGTSLG